MHIPSSDGTPIALSVTGQGPAILLVHGSGGSGAQFGALVGLLAERFTLAAMDRRGHGASGDAAEYAIGREAEDIAACLAAIGPAAVLGHSYGALCALEAARRGVPMQRLMLYEPPINTRRRYFPREMPERMRAALDGGDAEAVLVDFALNVRGASPGQVAQMRRMPGWVERCAMAPVLLRELEGVAGFALLRRDFRRMLVPTAVLTGSDSPPQYGATAAALARALPEATVFQLPGQRHSAIEGAPWMVAEVVDRFLR